MSVFYEGGLQAGIAEAITNSKLVACLVADDQEESIKWQDEFQEDEEISTVLREHTVLLRLAAGSQEAGFLAAFCPIQAVPTFVVIHNGQVLLYITGEFQKSDFISRLKAVVGASVDNSAQQAAETEVPEATSSINQTTETAVPVVEEAPQIPPVVEETAHISPVVEDIEQANEPDTTTNPTPPSTIQDLFPDRAERLERERRQREAAEKAAKAAKAKARETDVASTSNSKAGTSKKSQSSYAEEQKKLKLEAKRERERILRMVEDDKAARRERERQRRGLAAETSTEVQKEKLASYASPPPRSHSSSECALQIRLLDGSTVRSKFPPEAKLGKEVRRWVDEQRSDGDTPYSFKQVLWPAPNRSFSVSDEDDSLEGLDLMPNATLLMVPVHGYVNAYDGSAPGLVSRAFSMGYGLVSSAVGTASWAVGAVTGYGQAPQAGTSSQSEPSQGRASGTHSTSDPSSGTSSVRIQTLRDQRKREDHQLYNGNQLNFEPNKDDTP